MIPCDTANSFLRYCAIPCDTAHTERMSDEPIYCAQKGCRAVVSKIGAGCRNHSSNLTKKRKMDALEQENSRLREENEKLKKEVERLSSPQMGTNQVVDEVATLRREWSEMREKIRGKQSGASCVSFFNQRCSDRDSKHWCGVVEPKSA